MKNITFIIILVLFALSACNKSAEQAAQKPAETASSMAETMSDDTMPDEMASDDMMAEDDMMDSAMMDSSGESDMSMPEGHPGMGMNGPHDMMSDGPVATDLQRATVISSIDVPQFTYLEVDQDGQTRWLAATTVAVKKGDIVEFTEDSTMDNFTSKTLNRTFDTLTFVSHAAVVEE